MSGKGPILFDNKPKKSKLKAPGAVPSVAGASAPPSSSPSMPPPPPMSPMPPMPPMSPMPPPPSGAPFKFYKTLAVVMSVAAGAYFFARTVLKVGASEEGKPEDPTTSASSSTTPASAIAVAITEQPVTLPTVEPFQRLPIPEAQQRELLKWMLEEKRKVKPRDAEEKKRIDEEKAALKQFIRAKSLPTIF